MFRGAAKMTIGSLPLRCRCKGQALWLQCDELAPTTQRPPPPRSGEAAEGGRGSRNL